MYTRKRALLLIVLIAAICSGVVYGVLRYRAQRAMSLKSMVQRMPKRDAVLVYIDFGVLRSAGLLKFLSDPKAAQEPEYRDFVSKTMFDYRTDLDAALVAFGSEGKYFLVKGRFDWKSLRSYAISNRGDCYNAVCEMPGSTEERKISFFPVNRNLMAMAVSKRSSAVNDLKSEDKSAAAVPADPVWISMPGSVLQDADRLPTGTKAIGRALAASDRVTLTFGAKGDHYEARLDAECKTEGDAATIASVLANFTLLTRKELGIEGRTPPPDNLASVLASGVFQHVGTRVHGTWPIQRAFIDSLLSAS